MFDINGGELLIVAVLVVVLIGPSKLPSYAAQLARLVTRVRLLLADARERVTDELGPEVTDLDWSMLDPRRYDPRTIVRDALRDDVVGAPSPTDRPRAEGDGRPTNAEPAAQSDERLLHPWL